MSSKVRRFWYVMSPGARRSGIIHRAFDKMLEGEKLACGLRIQPRWKYGNRAHLFNIAYDLWNRETLHVCKRCEAA